MKKYRLIFSFILISILPVAAVAQNPKGWRPPTQKELLDDLGWRKEDPSSYLVAKADFDGDGKDDVASLLINDKENKMGLFVKLSSRGNAEPMLLEEIKDKVWIEVMGIAVAKPGEYKTACGKGFVDCQEGEPKVLRLKQPAIDFFKFESANSFFVWDNKTRRFNRIWMSD